MTNSCECNVCKFLRLGEPAVEAMARALCAEMCKAYKVSDPAEYWGGYDHLFKRDARVILRLLDGMVGI